MLCDARKAVGNESYTCQAPLPSDPGRHVNCTVDGAAGGAADGWECGRGALQLWCVAAAPLCFCEPKRCNSEHANACLSARMQGRKWKRESFKTSILLCKMWLTWSLACERTAHGAAPRGCRGLLRLRLLALHLLLLLPLLPWRLLSFFLSPLFSAGSSPPSGLASWCSRTWPTPCQTS